MRPWQTWALFIACLAVVLAVMVWSTWTVLRLERGELDARRQAAAQETVRLALWRMESALGPLVARESSYPHFAYAAFYPADRAYKRGPGPIGGGSVLIPSPLLTKSQPQVLIHFQADASGTFTSPEVPAGAMRDLAERHGQRSRSDIEAAERRLAMLASAVRPETLRNLLPAPQESAAKIVMPAPPQPQPQPPQQSPGQTGQQAAALDVQQRSRQQSVLQNQAMESSNAMVPAQGSGSISYGLMQPEWIGQELLLARRVSVDGRDYVQGSWLDWPSIRSSLLAEVQDLLPAAGLQPAREKDDTVAAFRLAALPTRLVPGAIPWQSGVAVSSLRMPLVMAWACMLLAALAVAVLVKGAMSLSERRATFVSAVTHELRTPLTTFRLYTEMLEEGRVSGEERRRQYLVTLRSEAERLCHLVDNVLAYARLERGRPGRRLESVNLKDFLAQAAERLADRAGQAGMHLVVTDAQCAAAPSPRPSDNVQADAPAVEQILLNLVDNACKYAASAENRAIEIAATVSPPWATIRVRDHGPGLSADERRTLFKPFHKSARRAAESAPGVGLGLSLSRRLARDMGGDLRLDEQVTDGACFVLTLRAV